MPVREPGAMNTKDVFSPSDPELCFTIKRAGVAENLARKNMASTLRYIDTANGQVTERDVPLGDLELDTVLLCLARWNVTDSLGKTIPINAQTLTSGYISPEELDFVYREILDFNPLWGGTKDDEGNSFIGTNPSEMSSNDRSET